MTSRLSLFHRFWRVSLLVLLMVSVGGTGPGAAAGLFQGAGRSPRDIETIREALDAPNPDQSFRPAKASGADGAALSTAEPGANELYGIRWSRMAFEGFARGKWDIFTMYPGGSQLKRLTDNPWPESSPHLAPGGKQVVFTFDKDARADDLYVMDVDTLQLQSLAPHPGMDIMPVWSPDGSQIAFQSNRSGSMDLFVVKPDGSDLTQLTHSPAFDGYPSWSPDGKALVFTSNRTGAYELWVVLADGSGELQLTQGESTALYPAWSPDGYQIAYSKDTNGDGFLEMWLLDLIDGTTIRLNFEVTMPNADEWGAAWSPDGQWLGATVTYWLEVNGKWYWTRSRPAYLDFRDGSPIDEFPQWFETGDEDVWKITWSSEDIYLPDDCRFSVITEQRTGAVVGEMLSADYGGSGIRDYELQVRVEGEAWAPYSISSSSSFLVQSPRDGLLYLRCRARDWAGNQSIWNGDSSVHVDGTPPTSWVRASQPAVLGSQVTLTWEGRDAWLKPSDGMGIKQYDVYWRTEPHGDWQLWERNSAFRSETFNAPKPGVYSFRVQATDWNGHVEPWQPAPQASVVFASHAMTGTILDTREMPIWGAKIGGASVLSASVETETGAFHAYLNDTLTETITATAEGYGSLAFPAAQLIHETEPLLVLPPSQELVSGGGFDRLEDLDAWSTPVTEGVTTTTQAHSSTGALSLSLAAPGSVEVTQTLHIPADLHAPTLSFFYSIPADLLTGTLKVEAESGSGSTVFTASEATQGWKHAWVDLIDHRGAEVTLRLQLSGGTGQALLDQVSVGGWNTPQVSSVTPQTWTAGQQPLLIIEGQNFYGVPKLMLGSQTLSNVQLISDTQLQALAPASLVEGAYRLEVINPGGAAAFYKELVTVRQDHVYLPLVAGEFYQEKLSIKARPATADWGTLGYDNSHSGYNPVDPGASRYSLAWKTPLPYASPNPNPVVTEDGIVFVTNSGGSDSAALTFSQASGEQVWRSDFSDAMMSPPTAAFGRVFFQSGPSHYSFKLYSGEQVWQVQTFTYIAYSLPPVVTTEGYITKGGSSGLTALAVASGQKLWGELLEGSASSWAPAYYESVLYSWGNGSFKAFDSKTGTLLWEYNAGWLIDGPYTLGTAPVISQGIALVTCSESLIAIDLETHKVKWSTLGDFNNKFPAIADGKVYVIQQGKLLSLDLRTGKKLWQVDPGDYISDSVLAAGDYLYAGSYYNSFVFNRKTGEVVWQTDVGGPMTVASGYLFIVDHNSVIHAFRAEEP